MIYQGQYMDISIAGFQIPIASLCLLDILCILLFIPFMDKIVYPLLEKAGFQRPSQLTRIGIGMLFATAGMACAGGIEVFRRHNCCMMQDREGGDGNGTRISNITIFYQIPQYTLIGLSEVFTGSTGKFFLIYRRGCMCFKLAKNSLLAELIYYKRNRGEYIFPYLRSILRERGCSMCCNLIVFHITGITFGGDLLTDFDRWGCKKFEKVL